MAYTDHVHDPNVIGLNHAQRGFHVNNMKQHMLLLSLITAIYIFTMYVKWFIVHNRFVKDHLKNQNDLILGS